MRVQWSYTYPLVLKTPTLGWSQYQDANLVATSHIANELVTEPVKWLNLHFLFFSFISVISEREKSVYLAVHSALEPVLRCEPSTYQPNMF